MSFRFRKYEKLKSQKRIEQIFQTGKSVSAYPLRLYYSPIDTPLKTRFEVGFSVSKRHFKKAIDRNYIKRLLRENYRLNKNLLENLPAPSYGLMLVYTGKEIPDFTTLQRSYRKLIALFVKTETPNTP